MRNTPLSVVSHPISSLDLWVTSDSTVHLPHRTGYVGQGDPQNDVRDVHPLSDRHSLARPRGIPRRQGQHYHNFKRGCMVRGRGGARTPRRLLFCSPWPCSSEGGSSPSRARGPRGDEVGLGRGGGMGVRRCSGGLPKFTRHTRGSYLSSFRLEQPCRSLVESSHSHSLQNHTLY